MPTDRMINFLLFSKQKPQAAREDAKEQTFLRDLSSNTSQSDNDFFFSDLKYGYELRDAMI